MNWETVILGVLGIISPIVTTFLNNLYQLKQKRIEHLNNVIIKEYNYRKLLVDDLFESISTFDKEKFDSSFLKLSKYFSEDNDAKEMYDTLKATFYLKEASNALNLMKDSSLNIEIQKTLDLKRIENYIQNKK